MKCVFPKICARCSYKVLCGRKMVEVAVIEGEGSKETLISLELLKKWDLIHSTFPHQTLSDNIDKKMNKKLTPPCIISNRMCIRKVGK